MLRPWLSSTNVVVEGLMTINIQRGDLLVMYDFDIGETVEGGKATAIITKDQLELLKKFISQQGEKYVASLEEEPGGYKFSYISSKRKNASPLAENIVYKKYSKEDLLKLKKALQRSKVELGHKHLVIA